MDNRHYQAFANPSTEPSLSTLASEGYASSGSAADNQLPTVPGPAWYHSVSSEIHNAIKALGLDPDHLRIDQLASGLRALLPAGTVILSAGDRVPSGYLLCNGAAVSRTQYADLFTAIGTKYGVGDGASTFNLPDMRDRFAEGAGSHAVGTYLEAGLPNITGVIRNRVYGEGQVQLVSSGCFGSDTSSLMTKILNQSGSTVVDSNPLSNSALFDASRSSSIYGNSTTVQPKSLIFNYVIKY
jgi:microcystin-dependent protein